MPMDGFDKPVSSIALDQQSHFNITNFGNHYMASPNHAFETPLSMLSCSYNNMHSMTGPNTKQYLEQNLEEQFLDRPLDPSLQEPDT